VNARDTIAIRVSAWRWIGTTEHYATVAKAITAILVPPLATAIQLTAACASHVLDLFGFLRSEVVFLSCLATAFKMFEHCLCLLSRCNDYRFAHGLLLSFQNEDNNDRGYRPCDYAKNVDERFHD